MEEVSSVDDNEETNPVELIAEGEFLFRKGKYADLIVLDKNPLDTDKKELRTIKVLETFVNGNKIISDS